MGSSTFFSSFADPAQSPYNWNMGFCLNLHIIMDFGVIEFQQEVMMED